MRTIRHANPGGRTPDFPSFFGYYNVGEGKGEVRFFLASRAGSGRNSTVTYLENERHAFPHLGFVGDRVSLSLTKDKRYLLFFTGQKSGTSFSGTAYVNFEDGPQTGNFEMRYFPHAESKDYRKLFQEYSRFRKKHIRTLNGE